MKRNKKGLNLEIGKKVEGEFKSLLGDNGTKSMLRISLILILLAWILIGLFYKHIPPEIPIFFSKPWGVDQLADKWFLLVLMGALTGAFVFNTRFASMSIAKDKLLANIFLVAQLFFSILVFIIVVRLIWLIA